MNRLSTLIALFAVLFAGCQENKPEDKTEPEPEPQTVVPVPGFAKGADVSWASEMEKDGRTFRLKNGTQADIFDVLKELGINSIRLRVWVNPTGGWSGPEDVVRLASRAYKAGLAVMVDFHYSDFFADPASQTIPKAWEADKADVAKMAKHVSDHTSEVLTALKDAGVAPAWVQVGNETRNGMLWPLGQLWSQNGSTPGGWGNFTQLYNAGYEAAKSVFPDAIVMPHLNNAFKATDNAWWFGEFKKNGGKFDAVALSHYPQTEKDWSVTQTQAVAYIRKAAADLGVPVYVTEVGVKTNANETLAKKVLTEFMTGAKNIEKCAGVFYWEPEVDGKWKPAVYNSLGWNAYDMGAFTTDGKATSVMDAFLSDYASVLR